MPSVKKQGLPLFQIGKVFEPYRTIVYFFQEPRAKSFFSKINFNALNTMKFELESIRIIISELEQFFSKIFG